MSTPHWLLSPPLIRFVFFVERWVLSVLFFYLGWEYLDTLKLLHLVAKSQELLPSAVIARDAGFLDGVHFEDFARYTLLAGSNMTCGLLLLISKTPARYPSRASEVLVPLLATFSYILFNNHTVMPMWMTIPFIPNAWAAPLALVGVLCSAMGTLFSLGSILCLGRSLGIVVSVRDVVLAGPYRYVRHPIYLGYFFVFGGLFLTAFTMRMLILVAGVVTLLWWRARLEENLLAAHSESYREWMKHTGFLWPKRPKTDALEAAARQSPVKSAPAARV